MSSKQANNNVARVVEGNDGRICLEGNLVFSTVMDLLKQERIFSKNHDSIIIDFSKVVHADSAGLALLLEWWREAKHANKKIIFDNLPKQLLKLAHLSRLDELFQSKNH